MTHDDAQVPALARRLGLNRRQFFAATTGLTAAAATVGPLAGSAAAATGPTTSSARTALIPAARRGIILYTVRDAIARDPRSTPLPSGFKEVLKELSRIGYAQIEFAGFRQHENAPGGADLNSVSGARRLRRWLDEYGLEAEGNHGSVPSEITAETLAQFDRDCEIANILGLAHIGTGGDPTRSPYVKDWHAAAEVWNALGRRAARHGLKLYTHNHDEAYSFLLDTGPKDESRNPTRSSGIRRLEYFLEYTDPKYVFLEMDIFWANVARLKYKTYTAKDGSTVKSVFRPVEVVAAQPNRFPLFHVKDGKLNPESEMGYDMVPLGFGDIDYGAFFRRVPPAGRSNPMWEQDTAPGGDEAPSQSLDFAEISYDSMSALRR